MTRRKNPDRLRELQRKAKASGDIRDYQAYVRELTRVFPQGARVRLRNDHRDAGPQGSVGSVMWWGLHLQVDVVSRYWPHEIYALYYFPDQLLAVPDDLELAPESNPPPGDRLRQLQRAALASPADEPTYWAYVHELRRAFPQGTRVRARRVIRRGEEEYWISKGEEGFVADWSPLGSEQFGCNVFVHFPHWKWPGWSRMGSQLPQLPGPARGNSVSWHALRRITEVDPRLVSEMDLLRLPDDLEALS